MLPTAVHSPHETLSLALGSEHQEGETCFYTDGLWQITCGKRKTGEFLFLLGVGHCPWGLLLGQRESHPSLWKLDSLGLNQFGFRTLNVTIC